MEFQTAIKTCLKDKYFCFKGRASRSEFWYFYLFNIIISTIALFLDNLFAPLPSDALQLSWIFLITKLGLLVPDFAVTVRRLHDTNRSGWLAIVPYLAPVVCTLAFFLSILLEDSLSILLIFRSIAAFLLVTLIIIVLFFVFIVFFSQKGTQEDNRFGPPPEIDDN